MSSPWGLENSVSVIPSSAALAFMAATKASLAVCESSVFIPSPNVSAIAMAASLPEGIMSPASAASRVSVSPAHRLADDSPT